MPEIAEVARIVHHLRKSLVGKTIAKLTALEDGNVFGKVGTSASEIQKSLTGKKILEAGQQGKYFWLTMSSPPHLLMHFGMTGWFHIKGEETYYYRRKEGEEEPEWPPRFWKFLIETKEEPKVEAAFKDARRFARVRLLDCAAADIRKTTPLKENGPDPVIDKEIFTEEWLEQKMKSKHVPVKALLLDQANISGIGNWVGDEIMYHAKLHPEQYSDTFTSAQLKQLHTSIRHICQTACDLLSDSEKFPEDWLFKHRWGKGKKDAPTTLPNGEKITFLTVGGRTSCVVPSVQKKTGPVAGDANGRAQKGKSRANGGGGKKRKAAAEEEEEEDEEEDGDVETMEAEAEEVPKSKGRSKAPPKTEEEAEAPKSKRRSKAVVKAEEDADVEKRKTKRQKASESDATPVKPAKTTKSSKKAAIEGTEVALSEGRRRSGRVTKK